MTKEQVPDAEVEYGTGKNWAVNISHIDALLKWFLCEPFSVLADLLLNIEAYFQGKCKEKYGINENTHRKSGTQKKTE